MNIKLLSTALLFIWISVAHAQAPQQEKAKTDIYTPLKPKDASPYVFSSEQELRDKKQQKKNAVLDQIKQNENDREKVLRLREQLWRIENAVVKNSSTK